jgi:hypothetical protein
MTRTIKHAALWACTAVLVMVVLTVLLFSFGPRLEAAYAPVVVNMKGIITEVNQEHTKILITGNKVRSCLTIAMHVDVLFQGQWIAGQVRFLQKDGTELKIPMVASLQVRHSFVSWRSHLQVIQSVSAWNQTAMRFG